MIVMIVAIFVTLMSDRSNSGQTDNDTNDDKKGDKHK